MSAVAAPTGTSSLKWGLPESWISELDASVPPARTGRRGPGARRLDEAAQHWRRNPGAPSASLADALVCLAWAYHAVDADAKIEDETRSGLLQTFADLQVDFANLSAESQPLAHLWLHVELPLVLLHGSRVAGRDRAEEAARDLGARLAGAWPAWLDAEGLPHATVLPHAWMLLASWVRCARHWRDLELPGWSDNLHEQFDVFLQQMFRLLRNDGSVVFAGAGESRPGRELIAAALDFASHAETYGVASCAGALPPRFEAPKQPFETPLTSDHSETAGLAVMRSEWGSRALQAAIAFHGDESRLELTTGKQSLLSGAWEAIVSLDGTRLTPQGAWREVVWFSDDEVDYLEIEIDLNEHWRIQRQFLLHRPGRLFLMADAVLGEEPASIEYRGRLSLHQAVRFEPESDTHEGRLHAAQPLAIALPLAYPEWRGATSDDELAACDGQLTWSFRGPGKGLYMPVVFACDRKHLRQPYTWRRLTVGESLQPVPANVAAGFRVQFGRQQWLFYRALGAVGNRTVLGQNVACDFLAAEFKADGTSRPIVSIET